MFHRAGPGGIGVTATIEVVGHPFRHPLPSLPGSPGTGAHRPQAAGRFARRVLARLSTPRVITAAAMRSARVAGWVLAGVLALPFPSSACPGPVVRIVVPVVAGGPMDQLARSLAEHLARDSGQPHVVENRPGAMTIPAWDAVAKAPADGCTLLVASTSGRTVLPWQHSGRLPFDPARDLLPVTSLADVPQLFVAHPASGIRSLPDLVRRAREHPQGVSIAIPTPGAMAHLAAVALQRETGIRLNEIPYRGGAPAAMAVRTGEVAVMSADIGAVLPLVRAGELVPLATASARRLPPLPDVPTVAEAGFGALEAANVYAMFAPAGLSPALLQRLHARVAAAMQRPPLVLPLRQVGMVPRVVEPAAFEAELRQQERRLEPLARSALMRSP